MAMAPPMAGAHFLFRKAAVSILVKLRKAGAGRVFKFAPVDEAVLVGVREHLRLHFGPLRLAERVHFTLADIAVPVGVGPGEEFAVTLIEFGHRHPAVAVLVRFRELAGPGEGRAAGENNDGRRGRNPRSDQSLSPFGFIDRPRRLKRALRLNPSRREAPS